MRRGATAAVVIGSDCPGVTPAHLSDALAGLESGSDDVVIGPAEDGGYWLLGINARFADRLSVLFDGIDWGSTRVFRQTSGAAEAVGATVGLLPVLSDIDRAMDLPLLDEAIAKERSADAPRSLSVVIPALNEEATISDAVRAAFRSGADEVVVADGGSKDATREIAALAEARVVVSSSGRAAQMNAGAMDVRTDALLFLHADCQLPLGAVGEALRCLEAGTVAGAFAFCTDSARLRDRWAGSAGRLRHRVTGHPYGDQGLFLSTRTFRDLGGFPELPVMEDWEMVRRLRRVGEVRILRTALPTSARGWQQHGVVRSTCINAAVIAGYRLGVRPELLAALRRSVAMR